jgi:hypothetical protein
LGRRWSDSGCLGFDIVRIYLGGTGEKRGLAAWVPFKGQDNEGWKEQDTGVWPVQKTNWRDLTLRRRRDRAERRDDNVRVKYSIRPVGRMAEGLERVPVRQEKTYTGNEIPLGYLGAAVETNEIFVTSGYGDVHAAFTNGILAGQWVLGFLERLIGRANEKGGKVYLALYELDDAELVDLLIANKSRIEIILSNSSADRDTGAWDSRNAPARKKSSRFMSIPNVSHVRS